MRATQIALFLFLYMPGLWLICYTSYAALVVNHSLGWQCSADDLRDFIGLPIVLVYWGIRIALGRRDKNKLRDAQ